MNRFILVLALGLFLFSNTFAQDWKRTQNWYFGDSAGLSFATDPPTVLTDGQMYALEGCATISDTAGNLLFYTNGMTVWNKNHEIMDNGTGLTSNQSYTQAALIVPQPGNDSIFFIFTTGYLRYSIVNILRGDGLGEVVEKNSDLILSGTEKLAATFHSNGHDVWISTHGKDNNQFFSFLLTKNGIVSCPIVSQIGSVMSSQASAGAGEMEFSYSGNVAAVSFFGSKFFELYTFDNVTGEFGNPIKVNVSPSYPYGICFSLNEKFIYLSERNRFLVQYNISNFQFDSINNSRVEISALGNADIQGLQIIPSGEILVTNPGLDSIGIILFPNESAPQCQYIPSYVSLGMKKGTHNFPNFISSYYYQPKLDIHYTTNCKNDSVAFFAKSSQSLASPAWSIYQNSNLLSTGSGQALNYFFEDTGNYLVRLIDNTDTVEKSIFIEPHLTLGNDTVLCNENNFTFHIPNNIRCLQWQDGSDTATYSVTKNGVYYISGYNNKGCKVSDTISVKFGGVQQPTISRSGDSLFTDTGSYEYTWYLNGTKLSTNTNALRINEPGNYSVEVSDSIGCKSISSIFPVTTLSVSNKEAESVHVFPNPLIEGQNLTLEGIINTNQIQIYTTLGTQVHSYGVITQSDSVIISGLQKGVYILVINETARYKILVQ